MSIVRVGLGENKEFADGYEAIFGKRDKTKESEKKSESAPKDETAEKKTEEKK